MMSIMDENKP